MKEEQGLVWVRPWEESSPWLRTERVFLHAGECFLQRERVLHELYCRWMRSRSVCSGLFFLMNIHFGFLSDNEYIRIKQRYSVDIG
jgi:hypothetical protein